MKAQLVNQALLMALWSRKPKKDYWHTDRGSQYASESHRNIIVAHYITQSMSRKGNCWDNCVPRERPRDLPLSYVRAAMIKSHGSERRWKRRNKCVRYRLRR